MRWLPLVLLLGACTATVSSCPPVVPYSKEFQMRAQAQLATIDPASPVAQMIVDYGQERAALRACRS